MRDIAAQQVDHAQCGVARAAIGLDKEREPVKLAGLAQQSIEADNVIRADAALGRVPVADDGFAEQRREILDELLRLLYKHWRLGGRVAALVGDVDCFGFRGLAWSLRLMRTESLYLL